MKEITLDQRQSIQTMPRRAVFKMEKNERMAGGVPVWKAQETAKEHVAGNLAAATNPPEARFSNALSYAGTEKQLNAPSEEFGFGDLIDMVNPLQHIPIVSNLYRKVTGDEIKPVSQIVGGAAFGGFIGAASGIANVIVEQETGKDITGNVMALVTHDGPTARRSASVDAPPERQLESAIEHFDDQQTLTGTALSFVDLGHGQRRVYEHVQAAGGRTAGTMIRSHTELAATTPAEREPITTVELSPMPPRFNSYDLNS